MTDYLTGRRGTIAALVLAVGIVTGFAARAVAGSSDSASAARPTRTITVSSTATVKASPDEAVVSLGVQSESAANTQAFAQNAKDMQAVLDALQQAGVPKSDVKTTNLSLYKRSKDHGKTTVFVANNQVEVTIKNLSSVGSVIDAAVTAGADQVNDIRFQLADSNQIRTDALGQAVNGARQKADALASAAGVGVTGVVTIREDSSVFPSLRSPFSDQAVFAGALAGAPTPIVPPNSLESRVSVTVVFAIG